MIPRFGEWNAELGPRGLTVLGVHAPETANERHVANLRAYVARENIRWKVLIDPEFSAWNRYHVQAWPTAFLIDRRGTIRNVFVGDSHAREIRAALDQLLAERP